MTDPLLDGEAVAIVALRDALAQLRARAAEVGEERLAANRASVDRQAASLRARAEVLYAQRRRRDQAFGDAADLFGEPAWDMLLHLYVQKTQDAPTLIGALCKAARVPTTTSLRWIARLEAAGLVQRVPAPLDRRQTFIALTNDGVHRVEAALLAS